MRAMSLVILSFVFTTQSFAAQLIKCEADANMLAKNIYGMWEYDAALSELIGDKSKDPIRLKLFPDDEALNYFAQVDEFLTEDTCVYAVGYLDIFISDPDVFILARPFILLSLDGAPVVYWLASTGKEFDFESFSVSFAMGSDDSLDRLIVGGDPHERQAMKFFKRSYM